MATKRQIIRQEAKRHGISPGVLYGVWGAESNFGQNPGRSSKGAQGDFQFMPQTAAGLGVRIGNFRSEARGAAKYLSQYKGRGTAGMLAAYNAGPAGNPNNSETRAYIPKVLGYARQFPGGTGGGTPGTPGTPGTRGTPGTVNVAGPGTAVNVAAAFAQAQETAGPSVTGPSMPTLLNPQAGLLNPQNYSSPGPSAAPTPSPTDLSAALAKIGQDSIPKIGYTPGKAATLGTPGTSGGNLPTGVANFEGKQVAAWIKPALVYARKQGWKGTVQSGFRSRAAQQRIWDSGVRPAAKPGTSNHEGDVYPRGAVDVDRADAQALANILRGTKYGRRLKYAGAKDPVHFSHPHGGSY